VAFSSNFIVEFYIINNRPRAQPGRAKGFEALPPLSQVKVEKKDKKF